jgi:hypothetical protein
MPRTRRITKSVALGVALACAATLAPRIAVADREHRGEERRDTRYERHDERRHEGRGDRRDDSRYERHAEPRYDRHHDYDRGRWEHPRGRVVIRIGGPPVAPAPVRAYYDPYCRTSYASLGLFSEHALRHGHLSFVWVLENGRPRYASRYAHDRWEHCDEWWPREGWDRHCD